MQYRRPLLRPTGNMLERRSLILTPISLKGISLSEGIA
jgi:hypothetical protein